MWRDLERVCAKEGLALRRPTRFPRSGLLAARVACAAADELFWGNDRLEDALDWCCRVSWRRRVEPR
jgi:2-hydroxychromene-2-carboxylate isomerase